MISGISFHYKKNPWRALNYYAATLKMIREQYGIPAQIIIRLYVK
jgi:hypothetical protein